MDERRTDPRKQFSKWLARNGAFTYDLFLAALFVLMYFRPETANACIYIALILSANKALDTISYTNNSKSEKILLAMLDKTRMELTLKNTPIKAKGSGTDTSEEENVEDEYTDDDEIIEEGGNG